jgi:glycosyltransferase involved in cell wall biosynthesis
MEAQATGLPCITTAHAGNADVISPCAQDYVVPPGDVEALAGALANMSTLPSDRRDELQHEGRKWIEGRYDLARTVEGYDCLYRRLITSSDC